MQREKEIYDYGLDWLFAILCYESSPPPSNHDHHLMRTRSNDVYLREVYHYPE